MKQTVSRGTGNWPRAYSYREHAGGPRRCRPLNWAPVGPSYLPSIAALGPRNELCEMFGTRLNGIAHRLPEPAHR
jgi:hypothetical protein